MAQVDSYAGRILIVDDEAANVILLQRMLERAGYTRLASTQDSREVLRLFQETAPDLILLDLLMPHLDGYAVMDQLAEKIPDGTYLPILVLTADATPQALRRALSAGAKDFLTKPFDQTELLLRVKNLLETRYLYRSLQLQVESLERLNENAQRAVLQRDESLSTITHDMGQPLAALSLTTELLQQELAESERPEPRLLSQELQSIEVAARQMSAMLTELSDLARLQMGRELVLQRRVVDLVALIRGQVELQKKVSRRHSIRMETEVAELAGNWDAMRIGRVISNLLNNAVKFSPKGGEVVVSIRTESMDGAAYARVSVQDQGLGIPAEDLPHIF